MSRGPSINNAVSKSITIKGQDISEGNFGVFNFPKKILISTLASKSDRIINSRHFIILK